MAWVQKVTVSEAGGERIREAAESADVQLSVHAPYYINLNSRDPEIVSASVGRIVAAGRGAGWTGARDVVLHLGYYHEDEPTEVFPRMADGLLEARERLNAEGHPQVLLRPELMGRAAQFGNLDEVLRLTELAPGIEPCIDIAHLHARTGAYNTRAEFDALWDAVEDAVGPTGTSRAHIHISGIEYGDLGEVRHLSFDEADLDYRTFLEVAHDRALDGTLVVESPARETDVLLLKRCWTEITATVETTSKAVDAASAPGQA